jgi:hypothetical protein
MSVTSPPGIRILQRFKQALTLVGRTVPEKWALHAQITLNYVKLGRWMTNNGFRVVRRFPNRLRLFDALAKDVAQAKTLYLEFGVYQGESIRYWSRLLKHPESLLHGFDSFEGLPEDFDPRRGLYKRAFDVGGTPPLLEDPRVSFSKGWFTDVLREYQVPSHDQLVVTLDADLYSSTLFVLRHLDQHIVPGTFLYFDDMSQPDHEPRAFTDYMQESGKQFRLFGADYSLNCCVFECVS